MRVLLISLVFLFLTGCFGSNTKPEKEIEYITVPEFLTQECRAERPEEPTLENVIESQKSALDQCNTQLKSIRDFNDQHSGE